MSHVVQSTRAGAIGGLSLAGVVLAALVLKYPFFEYGPRYAAATGRSLVEGYREIGRWAVWLYLLITLATAPIVQAAILPFTASLLGTTFGFDLPLPLLTALLYVACAAIVLVGRFATLDRVTKGVIAILSVSTLAAAVVAIPDLDVGSLRVLPRTADGTAVSLAFVLALAGWMPSAIDISVWSSLWSLAKDDQLGYRVAARHSLTDFRIGYVGTGVMALAFLVLGTVTMHQTGAAFSQSGPAFASELVNLYGATLGAWMEPIVHVAVLSTMFSTSLAVVDGFPRALGRTAAVLRGAVEAPDTGAVYLVSMGVLAATTTLIPLFFLGGMTAMVDFATIVAFLTAPALGYINLRAVHLPSVPSDLRPGPALVALSWLGLALLGGLAAVFLAGLI